MLLCHQEKCTAASGLEQSGTLRGGQHQDNQVGARELCYIRSETSTSPLRVSSIVCTLYMRCSSSFEDLFFKSASLALLSHVFFTIGLPSIYIRILIYSNLKIYTFCSFFYVY